MGNKHVNAVVVGAGAGGGVVAKELSEAGMSVVLLERGRWQGYDDHPFDELISQRSTPLGNAFGPDNRHPRVVADSRGAERVVLPHEGGYNNNAGCVGGGTLSYGAMAWRFMPEDFRMRSVYGEVEGSTLADWPIAYDDLEPYYEKAEWEIGVSGDDSQNPFAPPRRRPQPMRPAPYTKEGALLAAAGERAGCHPFPIPMLRNTERYGGRAACRRCRYCVGFACAVDAKCGTHNTVIPRALKTGNCELRTESIVARIDFDDKGRATGVRYFDKADRLQRQTADVVVVAASATESARLLLNSKHDKLFPNGAGNNSDWVGRNLQGHAYSGAIGFFDELLYDDVGPGACVAFCDYNHHNSGLVGGGMLANEFIRLPYLYSQRSALDGSSWGRGHKEFMRATYRRHASVKGPVQELPVFEARVEIHPTVKDHWGIPVLRLSGSRHPNDVTVGRFLAERAEVILKEAGAVRTQRSVAGLGLSGGQHQAGTCRMGTDPTTSVTDRFGRVHDVENLFVADGSLHVTNGGFNPVLTIMALGYWVSSHLIARASDIGIKG